MTDKRHIRLTGGKNHRHFAKFILKTRLIAQRQTVTANDKTGRLKKTKLNNHQYSSLQ